jgi:hypothetical protein
MQDRGIRKGLWHSQIARAGGIYERYGKLDAELQHKGSLTYNENHHLNIVPNYGSFNLF